METLASGYRLVEAPRFDETDGSIAFTDVLGGGVYRRGADGTITTVVPKRRGVGGLLLHADGGVVCSGRDVIHVRDGETRTLLAAPDGITGFNDMTADAAGRVYAGGLRYHPFANEEPIPGGMWRIAAAGEATEIFGAILWPNGTAFAPDGRTLYLSDYRRGEIVAHDIAADGTATGRRVLAATPSGEADGMAVDEEGAVWVALGSGGALARYRPDGTLDRILDVPAAFVTTCSFGGEDRRDLLIGTYEDPEQSGRLLRARVDVPGIPVARATI